VQIGWRKRAGRAWGNWCVWQHSRDSSAGGGEGGAGVKAFTNACEESLNGEIFTLTQSNTDAEALEADSEKTNADATYPGACDSAQEINGEVPTPTKAYTGAETADADIEHSVCPAGDTPEEASDGDGLALIQ
jgi:hypothetical protein